MTEEGRRILGINWFYVSLFSGSSLGDSSVIDVKF